MSSRRFFFKNLPSAYIQIGRTHLVGQIVPRFKSYCAPNENLGSPKKVEQKFRCVGTKSIFFHYEPSKFVPSLKFSIIKKQINFYYFFFLDFDANRTAGVTYWKHSEAIWQTRTNFSKNKSEKNTTEKAEKL